MLIPKIVVIMQVLFPGESYWEEVARSPVASFEECRIVQRELRNTLTTVDGLPFITQCADENSEPSGTIWMRTDKKDNIVTTTTTKKAKK